MNCNKPQEEEIKYVYNFIWGNRNHIVKLKTLTDFIQFQYNFINKRNTNFLQKFLDMDYHHNLNDHSLNLTETLNKFTQNLLATFVILHKNKTDKLMQIFRYQ